MQSLGDRDVEMLDAPVIAAASESTDNTLNAPVMFSKSLLLP